MWHRRAGKDELALHWTAVAAFQRVGNYWHTLPKQNQARKAIWQAVNPHTSKRRIDEAFPPALRAGVNDQEMMIRFKNGATWQVVGSDNFNSLVGSPPVGIVFSEWALCDPSSWAYMRPILLENGGWSIRNTTPRGRNHAYRTLQSALKEPGLFGQILRAEETGVFTPEQLEAERRQLIDDYGPDFGVSIYEQEYECSFDAANLGAILGRWLSRAAKQGRMRESGVYDPDGAMIDISSDIGFRDTAAWWYWQPRYDGFGLVRYDGASGLEADEWIDRIKSILTENGYKLGKIYLPHDAENKSFAAKRSPLERFTAAFGWRHVEIVPKTTIFNRINAARRIIESCVFDRSACADGIDGLVDWSFDYDEETKSFSKDPLHNWASHPGDAFSYGAEMMELRRVTKEEEKPRFPHELTFNELVARQRRKREDD